MGNGSDDELPSRENIDSIDSPPLQTEQDSKKRPGGDGGAKPSKRQKAKGSEDDLPSPDYVDATTASIQQSAREIVGDKLVVERGVVNVAVCKVLGFGANSPTKNIRVPEWARVYALFLSFAASPTPITRGLIWNIQAADLPVLVGVVPGLDTEADCRKKPAEIRRLLAACFTEGNDGTFF